MTTTSLTATVRAGFAAAALLLAGTAVAQAQTAAPADQMSPAPSASPAGSSNPGPSTTPTNTTPNTGGSQQVPARRTFTPFAPIIDVVATFTQPAYYGSAANIKGYDPLDVGGTVRIPVTPRWSFVFDRIVEGTVNQPLECILEPAAPGGVAGRVCPNDSRDVILQYHTTYALSKQFTVDLGDSFRHRMWNSGASGVSSVPYLCDDNGTKTGPNCTVSSTEHHYGYLGFSYVTKPIHEFFNSSFALAETLDWQNVDHHVAMVCTAAAQGIYGSRLTCPNGNGNVGLFDENPAQSVYYETTQGVTWILPLNHGTSFTVNDRWGALNFYENPTLIPAFGTTIGEPYRWSSALTYQLNKRFSPGFTLSVRHADYHSLADQGTPFVVPNSIHVGSWDAFATFHIDTSTWFGH